MNVVAAGRNFFTLANLFLAFCVAPFAGCGGRSSGDSLKETRLSALNNARILWKSSNISTYRYVIVKQCFCLNSGARLEVSVVADRVASVINLETGEEVAPFNDYYTINELFLQLEETINDDPAAFSASYDVELGYPRDVMIDRNPLSIDDEFSYELELTEP